MNTQRILEMARVQIPDLDNVGQDIYKGALNIDGKVAGIYYFDLSNKIPENFEDYQEQLLSDEFYNHPGSMQWNYYLFLLNNTLSAEQKKDIERDDRYARKFVFNEDEFVDFFHFEDAEKTIQSSIVTQWKGALDAADLQEVYGEDTYVDVFNRFDTNTTKKDKGKEKKGPVQPVDRIAFVNRVLLKETYRRYPQDVRDFSFGKVNLFQGINGVGKTSVFEAIELMLCGGTFRNRHQVNNNGCIEAEFNGKGNLARYQAKNPGLYQGRDLSWYATINSRGNTLYNSFNRFNYFNADAAQQFSAGGTESEISNALFNIVLGPEYTYIKERSSKMFTRVSPVYKKLETEIEQRRGMLADADKVIVEYKQPENLQAMLDQVNNDLKKIGFQTAGLDFQNQSALVEQENNRLQVLLAYFAEDSFGFDTFSGFQRALSAFEERKAAFSGLIEKVRQLGHELTEQQKNARRLEENREIVSKARGYLQDARFIELRGLEEKNRKLAFLRQKKQFVMDALGGTVPTAFDSELSLPAYIEQLKESIKTDTDEKNRLNQLIGDAIGKLGKLEGVIKEIKLAGAQYLELDVLATDCPLCQSVFERSVLEQRIKMLTDIQADGEQGALESNRTAFNRMVDKISADNARLQLVEKVRNAYQAYFEDSYSVPVKQVFKSLQDVINSIVNTDAELQYLRDVADFSRLSGRSEQELKSIDSSLEGILGEPVQIVIADLARLDESYSDLDKQISAQEEIRSKVMADRYAVGLDIKKLLGYPPEDQIDGKVAEEALRKEESRLETFRKHFEGVEAVVVLPVDASLTALKASSDLLKANIASYREAGKAEVEVNAARKTKKESERFIQDNLVRHERLAKAFETLKTLSENEESEKQLQEFFDQNFTEIADIFRSIHMPREFEDLRFDGRTISLKDEHGEFRGITEISTGQRSALALSIFLSLNKKLVGGPNLIMFDDPVAFIDDFNALSFLDYLRNFVLRSGRQIFFATANVRLANLFEKKFGFLENDFVRYDLKR